MKSKKGWIRIVEAFTAVLLITSVLLVFFNRDTNQEEFSSKRIFEQQQGMLRHIELNNSLRDEILGFSENVLPVSLEDFPKNLKDSIIMKTPSYLVCDAKICGLGTPCQQEEDFSEEGIYVQKTMISSSLSSYSPRELKLFCKRR